MTTSLSVSGLSVRLGQRNVLSDITFAIPPGALLAVLGPNGSGKSTLLKTLVGLVRPVSGVCTIGERSIEKLPVGAAGYVPQIKSLDRDFPARAIELVASATRGRWPGLLGNRDRQQAMDALVRVGAQHLADRTIGALSGGELQRIYLARAVMRKPTVLLLDEPETGIDASGTADLHQLLDSCRTDAGTAVVLVTHDWDAAIHHATHVLLLRNRQVSFGSPSDALRDDRVRSAFGHIGHAHTMLTGSDG